ncbi:MAG: pyruvate dehydrogenase (acetyl-transferring), homodimeric type [Acidimicrobiia bacterium]|nr:pyruvate dehydrogenase (acetyl-transferring), homodimeric type [Acidimicrobiia bacterium]
MIFDGFVHQVPDIDPEETEEWLVSLDTVIGMQGKARASFLIAKLLERARENQVGFPASVSTPYVNTIPREMEPWFPGDDEMERRFRRYVRWNAAAMVVRANKRADGIGGHLATYASSAALYEVGFTHFFRGKDDGRPRDHVYFQGHAAPGIYARAFLEGRLSDEQLDNYRQEVGGNGLSSYPHPHLMPDFWEFPTVSMGLGPLNAAYHARFLKYLENRRIDDTADSRVWCFLGDGEMDEPESVGALSIAGREKLDNLIFVVNCNLQRLDGPVRGNGKIIQELEAIFRGAGWNVIKVIWGSRWDELLARDADGVLVNKMNTTVDGSFQKYAVETGAYIRKDFFGPDPRLQKMVEHLSDEELQRLPRGGHDYRKLYAAYKAAVETEGVPTVILAKTIKGWTLGKAIEARNATHQIKKMDREQLLALRDRLQLGDEIPDAALSGDVPPYLHPGEAHPVIQYMKQRRRELDGSLPRRTTRIRRGLSLPSDGAFEEFSQGSGKHAVSTTVAFTRLLRNLLREPEFGPRVVPIIPDEARTFGMDALFREIGIYAPFGQQYEPVDADLLLSYTERRDGQLLEEGITEAGSMATFTAAGTSYATRGVPMVPFFTYYSMFGYQRFGDLVWAFGDARGRGFLLGATAGRTTLAGEGLQHCDGHSHVLFSVVPNCQAYDPAFAYETAAIVRHGIQRMYGTPPPPPLVMGDPASTDAEAQLDPDVFYYITLYNEPYPMPARPTGLEDADIVRGIYRFAAPPEGARVRARILFSGTTHSIATAAQGILADRHGVGAELWSVTSYKTLREDALSVERWNRLHPTEPARVPWVTQVLGTDDSAVVAVSDYLKVVPDQIARFVPAPFTSLGTDGFGRSDTRDALRRHFEIDAGHLVVAVLASLADDGRVPAEEVSKAIADHDIDVDAVDPRLA